MQVRLLTDRANHLEYQQEGTLIDVSDAEAGQLVKAGQAEFVSEQENNQAALVTHESAAPSHKRNSNHRGRKYGSHE